jgi:hypothetical protein
MLRQQIKKRKGRAMWRLDSKDQSIMFAVTTYPEDKFMIQHMMPSAACADRRVLPTSQLPLLSEPRLTRIGCPVRVVLSAAGHRRRTARESVRF